MWDSDLLITFRNKTFDIISKENKKRKYIFMDIFSFEWEKPVISKLKYLLPLKFKIYISRSLHFALNFSSRDCQRVYLSCGQATMGEAYYTAARGYDVYDKISA